MSSMDIDKPLDEIIASKPRTGRGGRGRRGGAGGRGASAGGEGKAPASAPGSARTRYAGSAPRSASSRAAPAAAPIPAKPVMADASKIIISNLPNDVTEAAVRDLMQSTVGPVRTVQMSYTAAGKSTGVATVLFKNKGDANKAHSTYHNRMIDNQRPMKVEIAIDPNALQTLASRVAPVPAAAAPRGGRKPAAAAGGRNANANAGGRAPRPRAARPAKKTAEDLDAEMANYKASSTA